MPNWREVDCQINFPDETEKKKLQAALDAEIAKAKAEDKGLFVGCKEKYLFFSAYSDDETEILITGDVKWSLQPEEMADWVRWFCSHAKISEITAKYNEPGFRILGEYTYDGKTLEDCWLPEEFYPVLENDDWDKFNADVENALDEHGLESVVDEIIQDAA